MRADPPVARRCVRCDRGMRSVPVDPLFTRCELRDCGWSDAAISRAVRSGRLLRHRRGVLSRPEQAGPSASALAAARACSGSVGSHRSALLLHGLPVVGAAAPLPELTVAPRRMGRMHEALLYRAGLPDCHITALADVPVTSVARTLIDVARHRPLASAVAAIDAALHSHRVTVDELDEVLIHCWNWPRIRRAQRALRFIDARSESPLESVSRLVLGWLDLPTPSLQPTIVDAFGNHVGRLDFYWDEFGVFGEADGRSKYDARLVLTAEKERQEALENLGLVAVRWGWVDLTRRRYALKRRVERAFERGTLRDRSGFRREWSVRAA